MTSPSSQGHRPEGSTATAAPRPRNPAASMALLEEVLDPPVGPGYHSAAQAREEQGLRASTGLNTSLMLVTALALGFLMTIAAVTLRAPDPAAAQTRADLITRIEAAQAAGDEQGRQVEALRAEILELEQEQARAAEGVAGQRAITAAGIEAGAQAVAGPGVVVTLNDAQPAAAPGEGVKGERVNSRDLQLVVNGLWSAGAEAISVNGHRLTSISAIRYAGEAIIVDFRGLTPPYEIRAIGDPAALQTETTSGVTGAYLSELRRQLSLQTSVSVQREITIGPGERLTTRVGHVPAAATPTKEDR
ncbi:DUF881 domain-containing protein [Ornithinimicrobium sp. Y1847]|uniref:DUF881 domain-containing protein n=1 Tax=unclassified Ornithinimicrobium TaxID=2615080 RepID=UPI003B675F74